VGYGAGGLGSGAARAAGTLRHGEAFDVMPDGRRAGTSYPAETSEVAAGSPPPGDSLDPPVVATGRREDGHYEPDAAQLLKARFTHRPAPGSIASQGLGATPPADREVLAGSVSDVVVPDDEASVWDARPGRT
jgi:hypothetical protein